MMNIVLNGEPHSVPNSQSLAELLERLGLKPEHVAIEMDRQIVRRPAWSETLLHEGARVEIVQFVGGG